MSLNYSAEWEEVDNTVNDRILDNSLLHTLNTDKKIKKQTKVLNQKLKDIRSSLRRYKLFKTIKKRVERAYHDGDETDDEPGLTLEAYQRIHSKKRKPDLQTFLRYCTQLKRGEYPKKTRQKRPSQKSRKPCNGPPTFERRNCKTSSRANVTNHRIKVKENTSISNSDIVKSESSKTQSQSSEIKFTRTRRVSSRFLDKEIINHSDIQKDDHTNEEKCIQKIVQDLISVDIDESPEFDRSTAIEDALLARNLPEKLSPGKLQYDVPDKSKTCPEPDNDSEVAENQNHDNCNVIIDVTDNLETYNSVSSCSETSDKDNPSAQEDIFMNNDETLSAEREPSNQNNNKSYIGNLHHDSGNDSLSYTDISRAEYGKSSNNPTMECDGHDPGFVDKPGPSMHEEESIAQDNISRTDKNAIKLNGAGSIISSDKESIERVKLSDGNLDSEGSKEIISSEQSCILQSEAELSIESAASSSKSKLKITIEHCDEASDIFRKHSSHKKQKLKTVNNFTIQSMENKSTSNDEQRHSSKKSYEDYHTYESKSQHLNEVINHNDSIRNKLSPDKTSLRWRNSFENGNLSQSDSQHLTELSNHEVPVATDSSDSTLQLENAQPMRLEKFSEYCNSSENESQHLNGLIVHEDSSPLFRSHPKNFNNSINNGAPLEGEGQAKAEVAADESSKEYYTSEIESVHLNQSFSSSYSSFSVRLYNEDIKNCVKTELISEIAQRLNDTSKKNRSSCTRSEILAASLLDETRNLASRFDSDQKVVKDELINDRLPIENNEHLVENNESDERSYSPEIQRQSWSRYSEIQDLFPKSSIPTKRRNSSVVIDHCSLENTPSLNKLPRMHEGHTNRDLNLLACGSKSQEVIPHKRQAAEKRDDSHDQNQEELNARKEFHSIPKRKPRPRNLEDYVAAEALSPDTMKPYLRLKDIGHDDEIWIMDIPKTINPEDLKDQMITLGRKSELKFGDDYYEVSSKPAKGARNVSCILATSRRKKEYKLASIELKGKIKFRQQFSVIPEMKLIPSKASTVPFPKNLRIRHPLFGANYEDKI